MQLDAWVDHARKLTQFGRLPDYIPLLAQANPEWFAVQVHLIQGQIYSIGEVNRPFVLMSVVKPFVLLFLLQHLGKESVFSRVGMQPSDQPFHSLAQLKLDRGFPRNPMINSGAIALASMLPGTDGTHRCETLRQWLNQMSGAELTLDQAMLASVLSLDNEANRAIAHQLAESNYLDGVETTLDTYNQICCLSGTVADLAKLGLLLAGQGEFSTQSPTSNSPSPVSPISAHIRRIVNALMLICGLYEASGRYAVEIGLPIKSGVSGALLAVVPGQGAIACYSPVLDSIGNSIVGLSLLEQFSQSLNLSVFSHNPFSG
jgi:glutaminase